METKGSRVLELNQKRKAETFHISSGFSDKVNYHLLILLFYCLLKFIILLYGGILFKIIQITPPQTMGHYVKMPPLYNWLFEKSYNIDWPLSPPPLVKNYGEGC